MAETTPIYGQTDALALAIVAILNGVGEALCLPVAAERRFARKLDLEAIAGLGAPVTVQVFPGDDGADLDGMGPRYDDTYGCHVLILQKVGGSQAGGLSEDAVASLVRLRSEIIEGLCGVRIDCPNAVHPFTTTMALAVRSAREPNGAGGVYDLGRLESGNLFYSDVVFTFKAVGLSRRNS